MRVAVFRNNDVTTRGYVPGRPKDDQKVRNQELYFLKLNLQTTE